MKKTPRRFLSFLLSLSLVFGMLPIYSASASAAADVHPGLINPGFEMDLVDGSIPGWTVDPNTAANGSIGIRTEQVRTGSKSLYFQDAVNAAKPNGSFRMLSNAIAVTAGDTVTFDVYVYRAAAGDQTHGVQPVIHYYNALGTEVKLNDFLNYGTSDVPVGSWHNISVKAEVPANTAYIKVGLYSGFPSITKLYVDDANLTIVPVKPVTPEPEPEPAGPLVNPGFEAALVDGNIPGWSIVPGTEANGSMEISAAYAKSGTKSLYFQDKVSGASPVGAFRILSNPIAVSAGDTVSYDVYVYKVAAADQSHGVQPVIHYYNEVGKELKSDFVNYGTTDVPAGTWHNLSISKEAPANTSYIKVGLYSGFPSVTKLYVDDARVTIVPAPPVAPPSGPFPNLINPGFEADLVGGSIQGWAVDPYTEAFGSIEISSAQSKSGNKSLYFQDKTAGASPNGSFRVLSNSIKASAGDKVTFEAYAFKAAAGDQSHGVQPVIHYYNEAGTEVKSNDYFNYGKADVPVESWHKISVTGVVPLDTAYIKVGFYSGFVSLTKIYFDDASITIQPKEVPQEPGPSPNIINPGFEAELVNGQIPGWSMLTGTTGELRLATDIVLSGTKSLHFKDTSTNAGLRVMSSKVTVNPGASLTLKANVYVINQTHNIVPQIYFYDATGEQVSVKEELFGSNTLGKNKWTEMRLLSPVPEGAAYARVAFYSGDPSLTEAYFDDVSVTSFIPEEPLDRQYGAPVDLGPMVNVSLGQAGAIQTNAKGENEVYFVTNGLPGTFYVLDAETGARKFSKVIKNTEATWAMTVGSDKNVYFSGTGDGTLYRYLPLKKEVEELGYNTADNWVWDIEEIDGKIYGGTFNDETYGKLFEYDIATDQFRNYGTVQQGQHYVRGIAVDDEYIYAGMGTTVQLFKVHRVTGVKTEIVIPGHSGVKNTVADVFKINNKLFVSVSTINMVVWDLETNTIDSNFQYSNMISEPYPADPNFIYYKYLTKLYKYDISQKKSIEIPLSVPLPDTTRVKDISWIQMNSGEKAGKTVMAMVTQYGEYILYDPVDNWVSFVELKIDPQPVRIQGVERGFDGRLYFGGYQRGMSIYNPFTNQTDVNVSSFAQPEGIGFLNDKVYYGTYVGAIMYSYDPTKPIVLNKNPELEYQIKHQDRPFAITSGDNKLFVGTVPDYGFLGGALAIYDEARDTWNQYDQVVKNQSIIGLAYKDGLLYGGTSVWGGLGINPSEPEAKMFVWDVANGKKIDEFTLDIPGIDEAPRMIGELSFGPDGLLWGAVDGTIFAMDVQTKKIVKSKLIQPSTYNTSKWMPFHLRWAPDGMLYTTLSRKIIAVDPETLKYKIIVNNFLNSMTTGIDGSIYFAPDAGAKLSRIAIPETDATLLAITVDGKPLDGFSPGVLAYTYPLSASAKLQVTATQAEATVLTEVLEASKQTVIHVLAKDGKSKLEYKINWQQPTSAELATEAAISAIEALPASITLADKLAVKATRELVEAAKSKGVKDSDITNLEVLVAAENKISLLELATEAAISAIEALPASITLADKAAVKAARELVDAAKSKGAKDSDITNLEVLVAGEARIISLEQTEGEPSSEEPNKAGNTGNAGNAGNEQKLVIDHKGLQKAAENGKVSINVPEKAKQIALPAHAAEAIGQNRLAIETKSLTLEIPSDLLKQLTGKVNGAALENGTIELKIEPLPQAESKKLIEQVQASNHASIKLSGEVIDFGLSFVTKSGEQTSLTAFNTPMTFRLKVSSGTNPKLAGVYYIANDGKLEYVGGEFRNGELIVDIHHFSKYAVLEYKKSFADVTAAHWANEVIEELTSKHMITGASDTAFEPERSITRAEFATLLVRALKLTKTGELTFKDIAKGSWYEAPISIAVKSGIVNGKSEAVFDPNGNITRQEMVAMLMRAYVVSKGVVVDGSAASAFSDESAVAPWALEYVRAAAKHELIQGREANQFVPEGVSTRAEAATILHRILK